MKSKGLVKYRPIPFQKEQHAGVFNAGYVSIALLIKKSIVLLIVLGNIPEISYTVVFSSNSLTFKYTGYVSIGILCFEGSQTSDLRI